MTLSPVAYCTPALAVGAGGALLAHVFTEPQIEPFLCALGAMSLTGGIARMMYDSASVHLTWWQQIGRVMLSVLGSLSVAMMLYDSVGTRTTWLMGFCVASVTAGPGIIDAVIRQFTARGLFDVQTRAPRAGDEKDRP